MVAYSGGTAFNFPNDVPHFDTYINSQRKMAALAAAANADIFDVEPLGIRQCRHQDKDSRRAQARRVRMPFVLDVTRWRAISRCRDELRPSGAAQADVAIGRGSIDGARNEVSGALAGSGRHGKRQLETADPVCSLDCARKASFDFEVFCGRLAAMLTTSYSTCWPSLRVLRPARSTAEMWTNTSWPPPCG